MPYTSDDFLECDDQRMRVHICLHLIYAYDMEVDIPSRSGEEVPIEALFLLNEAGMSTGANFQARYQMTDENTGVEGNIGPFVLAGMYEAFIFLMNGYHYGAVETGTIMAYGSFMVSCARPFYNLIAGCMGES